MTAPGTGSSTPSTARGDAWVVLLHGQLMPRRMHQPLARALAAEGLHVVTLDLLGHGRSDRPADPHAYSMPAFAEQVVALLDHLGRAAGGRRRHVAGRQRLPGGGRARARAGARADHRDAGAQQRARGRDPGVRPADVRRPVPAVHRQRACACSRGRCRAAWCRSGPGSSSTPATSGPTRWRPSCTGCSSAGSRRRRASGARSPRPPSSSAIPRDPIHPAADAAMLAEELPNATFVRARSILEWRATPDRLNRAAIDFALACWQTPRRRRRTSG